MKSRSVVRVLVVDDFQPFRRLILSMLQDIPEFQIAGEASDGSNAVRRAQELQPDLILLDIGLPSIDGIEAARRIREVSPSCKILFVTQNCSLEVVEAALDTGAGGYLLKSDANRLLEAIKTVLAGKRYISASLAGHVLTAATLTCTQTIHLSSILMLITGIR